MNSLHVVKRQLGLVGLLVVAACAEVTDGPAGAPSDMPLAGTARQNAKTATVVVHYPTGWGHRIAVRGDGAGLSWAVGADATWTEGDAWRLVLATATSVHWKPLFDDEVWSKGPNFTVAPGQTVDVWPTFFHDGGRFEQIDGWRSSRLTRPRDVVVYLPPSYDENPAERYPVVYMHDGQNLFFDADAFGGVSWDVAGAMDRGFADASIHEAIMVGVGNTADRIFEYTPTDGGYGGGGADAYIAAVADELKPEIDGRYRTVGDAGHTAVIGSSLGGLVSLDAGMARPDAFGLIGALSPSTWWDGTWIIAHEQTAAALPLRVYLDSGDAGDSRDDVDDTARLADTLRGRGATLDYVVQHGGQHNERYWRQRVPGTLGFLLGGR